MKFKFSKFIESIKVPVSGTGSLVITYVRNHSSENWQIQEPVHATIFKNTVTTQEMTHALLTNSDCLLLPNKKAIYIGDMVCGWKDIDDTDE